VAAANGWPAFFETQDLLRIEQLAASRHRDEVIAWIEPAPPLALAEGQRGADRL